MGLYYTLITCMDFCHHDICLSLNFFKVLVIWKSLFQFDKTFLRLLFYFFFLSFISFRFFVSFVFTGVRTVAFDENCLPVRVGVWVSVICPSGNCPKTVSFGGKQGDFLHANNMLGFIHLLYVQSCTFLYILNELNRVSLMTLYCIVLYLFAIYHKNVITYIQVC